MFEPLWAGVRRALKGVSMGESLDVQSLEGLGGTRGILVHRKRDRIELDRLVHRVDVSTGDRRRKHLKQLCRLIFPDAIIEEPVLRPAIRRRIPDGAAEV
jgi:hypothetical protein